MAIFNKNLKMKIVSYNVNGIRAALNKGFMDWLQAVDPDVVCLQEIKAFVRSGGLQVSLLVQCAKERVQWGGVVVQGAT